MRLEPGLPTNIPEAQIRSMPAYIGAEGGANITVRELQSGIGQESSAFADPSEHFGKLPRPTGTVTLITRAGTTETRENGLVRMPNGATMSVESEGQEPVTIQQRPKLHTVFFGYKSWGNKFHHLGSIPGPDHKYENVIADQFVGDPAFAQHFDGRFFCWTSDI
ncbi:MAG TPA: hypothetical protein VFG51_03925 [Candidatus Saccharimonadia bacterium]|nr:hypothetical protein [Candidatus Saccharimonadia bacterium]